MGILRKPFSCILSLHLQRTDQGMMPEYTMMQVMKHNWHKVFNVYGLLRYTLRVRPHHDMAAAVHCASQPLPALLHDQVSSHTPVKQPCHHRPAHLRLHVGQRHPRMRFASCLASDVITRDRHHPSSMLCKYCHGFCGMAFHPQPAEITEHFLTGCT